MAEPDGTKARSVKLRRSILGLMRHGFSETEVLAMTETAFVQYIDILTTKPDAGDQPGVKRFVRARNKTNTGQKKA